MQMADLAQQVFTNRALDLRPNYVNPAMAPGDPETPIRQAKARTAAAVAAIKRVRKPRRPLDRFGFGSALTE